MRTFVALMCSTLALSAAEIRVPLQPQPERKPAPAFALLDSSGKSVALSSFKGKPVLLDLWATKCGGCVKEIPHFIDLHHAYSAKGLAVVGVSLDISYEDLKGPAEAWALVNPFAKDHGVDYVILMGDDRFTKRYNVTALPVTYLLDKRGRIAATYVGLVDRENVEQNIRSLLSER